MNKEEKNSHVLPFKIWVVYFPPYCWATPQGIQEKYEKYRVIFDSSTQTSPDEVVLNHQTSTDREAVIDFGKAKTNLFSNIYNWWVSYPKEIIHLALADITACFRFPRISANVMGAFGYVAEGLYFISTSHVFGSNTLASSWEALWRAIQKMITVLSTNKDLVNKHRELLDLLKWQEAPTETELVQAFSCDINPGIKEEPGIITLLSANIYVDDILAAAAYKK
jgi:hypothetical protein